MVLFVQVADDLTLGIRKGPTLSCFYMEVDVMQCKF